MAARREIVIDCRHAPSLARFWAQVLDPEGNEFCVGDPH